MKYTLKEFAQMFGATEHTVRYYTDIGLLPCSRDGGNRRVFNDESVSRMQWITCLKNRGASIKAITEYCELCRRPESPENLAARRIILEQREQSCARLEEAKKAVEYMEKKVRHYEQILAGTLPDDTNSAQWAKKKSEKPGA